MKTPCTYWISVCQNHSNLKGSICHNFRPGNRLRGLLDMPQSTLIKASVSLTIIVNVALALSRRDDLESIAYMFIQFLRGNLPWQGIGGANKLEKYSNILDLKMSTIEELLCKDLPGMNLGEANPNLD